MKNNFALIFDMDGVVVDNYMYHKQAWRMFCEIHGLDFKSAFRSRVFGGTNKDHLETFFDRSLTSIEIQRYEAEKEALYRRLYAPAIEPVAGLIPFLNRARREGIPCALATSSPQVNVEFVLEKTNTEEYFSVINHAGSITKGKPDPEIFLITARDLGFPPHRCIVFEDSLNGIAAARRSGARVIALLTTHNKEDLPEVDSVLEDFEGLDLHDLQKLL